MCRSRLPAARCWRRRAPTSSCCNSRLADVEFALAAAHRARRIVRQNLVWAFAYNIVIIPLAAFGFVSPAVAAAGMAASSLAVVANALRAKRVMTGGARPR